MIFLFLIHYTKQDNYLIFLWNLGGLHLSSQYYKTSRFYSSKYTFTCRIIWWTAFFWHRLCKSGIIHSLYPTRLSIVYTSVTVYYGLFFGGKLINGIIQHCIYKSCIWRYTYFPCRHHSILHFIYGLRFFRGLRLERGWSGICCRSFLKFVSYV